MARALRIEFPGAIYHVMSRGNRKQASTPGSLSGPAKPVRGRRTANLKPETELDPAKPSLDSLWDFLVPVSLRVAEFLCRFGQIRAQALRASSLLIV